MLSKLNKLALAACLVISSTAMAHAEEVRANKWSPWDGIERVYAGNDFYFVMKYLTWPGGTCDGGRQFYISPTDPNYDPKVKTLLTAFVSGREIMFVWDGTPASGCRGHVDRLQVR